MAPPSAVDSERLRAAVIGCGWIGSQVADDPRADGIQAHAAAYASSAQTQLVAVCDQDAQRLERAAHRWGAAAFQSVAEMLRGARPEIVSVCTPDGTHAAILREVLQSPDVRAVIAEKPLAMDVADARSLVEAASRNGVTLAVNYTRRFVPALIEARRRLAEGAIGRLVAVQGLYTKGIIHNGSHWFDLARWFVGDIARIQAWPGPAGAAGEEPTCHARMSFAGGETGVLLGLNERCYTVFEMDILGTEGRLRIADAGMRLEWYAVAPSAHFTGYRTLQSQGEAVAQFRDAALCMVEDVVGACRTRTRPRCDGTDGVSALAASRAAVRSLELGTECALE